MWPFRKRYAPLSDIVISEAWSLSHGTHDGRALIARVNLGLKELAGHPDLRYQVGIAVPLSGTTDSGLPAVEADRQLTALEDELLATLTEGGQSVLAAVVTTERMREFVFYVSRPGPVQSRVKALQERLVRYDLQLLIQEDPTWRVYRSLAE